MAKAEALVGAEFDGYRIVRLLGQGGMGAVYEGKELALNRRVAIKILTMDINRNPDGVKRFRREAKAVASISHPNIAQVYRVGMYGDYHYYAMEYVDGKSLEDMIAENQRITGSRCFNLMKQMVEGLKAAADRDVIHRDIKPANIMVTKDGTVKIVDFGIAKTHDDSETFRTATGTIMGTPAYMSPEQCKGKELDFRADMYSLGCTFFHMATGRPPFDADTVYKVMAQQISTPVPSIPSVASNVPDRLANIIYTMMEKTPDNRYHTYQHLLTVLDAAVEGRAPAVTVSTIDERMAPREADEKRRREKMYYIGGGIVALIVLIFLISLANREPTEEKKQPVVEKVDKADTPFGGERGSIGKTIKEINEIRKDQNKDKDLVDQ